LGSLRKKRKKIAEEPTQSNALKGGEKRKMGEGSAAHAHISVREKRRGRPLLTYRTFSSRREKRGVGIQKRM